MNGQAGINFGSVIGIVLWALLPGFIARKKGRSFALHFFLSFLLSPLIMTIVALCESNKYKETHQEENSDSSDSRE